MVIVLFSKLGTNAETGEKDVMKAKVGMNGENLLELLPDSVQEAIMELIEGGDEDAKTFFKKSNLIYLAADDVVDCTFMTASDRMRELDKAVVPDFFKSLMTSEDGQNSEK